MLSARMRSLLQSLEQVALPMGYHASLLSGERDCVKQKALNSVRCSYHLDGNAIDVALSPLPLYRLPSVLIEIIRRGGARPTIAEAYRALGKQARDLGYRWGGDFRA